ncbi:S8 family serine peptidase [Neobacillus sp. NPDC058068]|uniref:S8 family serine peptidase n=1 Tax=Neobacillus sp. NPDC058068 TaxID=3346325 RepID=UPI0036DABBB2
MKKKSFFKRSAAITLTAGLLLSPFNPYIAPKATATSFNAEDILASLTPEQRQALNQLEMTDNYGLQGFSKEELKSEKEIDVIVQFRAKPGKVAVLDAEVKGKKLTKQQADEQVSKEHKQFEKDIQSILPSANLKTRKLVHKITKTYKTTYNGVAMKLPANQVEMLLKSDVVKSVYKNVEFKVDPIALGEEKASNNNPGTSVESLPYLKVDKLHEEGITGKGIKVGVIDTGIDYNHPDLKKVYKGGYDFVDNDNDPMETTYADWQKSGGYPEIYAGSAYYTSHGTHVAGTIAGQATNKDISVKGVAPDVDLYAYRVLGPYGSGTSEDVIAAIEKSVDDGMDVINLSLGAGINDPYYPTSTAINYAVLSGVTAVVAAGNEGPGDYTLGSPGTAALALTVGASDVPMTISTFKGKIGTENGIDLIGMARHYADQLKDWEGKSYQVVDVGLGDTNDYTGKNVQGKIALVARGDFALADKVSNAKQKGAVAVLLYNNIAGQIDANLGEATNFVPAFSITKEAGEKIKAQLKAGETSFTFSNYAVTETKGDRLADFSSRGPVRQTYGIKPEVTAPGVSVLSTVPSYMVDPKNQSDYKYAYSRYSGTSMATPFTAGVAALMLQANPKLKPEDIKTVLMNTADPLNGDYSVFEVGAGRVNPYQAIHNGASFQIIDKTFIPGAEDLVKVKALTGGLSFEYELVGKNVNIKKSINMKNSENVKKTFNISISESKGSNSLKQNDVDLKISDKIDLKAKEEKTLSVSLHAKNKAKAGIYAGYITLTNAAKSSEQYGIPFSFRTMEEGFNKVEILNPAYSPGYLNETAWDPFREVFVYSDFNMSAPMEKMDIVLQDTKTGNDLGLIGTVNLEWASDNVDYGLFAFNGVYYKFTGDSKQPISQEESYAPEGHYKLKFIGTGLSGKVKTETRDLWVYLDPPSFKSSLDGKSPFIEYKPGQETYPFDIQITDPLVDEMKKFGVKVDQASNFMVYYWGNWGFPSSPIHMDKDGKFVEEIAMDESTEVLPFSMDGYNMAGNKQPRKEYFFVKEGTPYTYPTSQTTAAKPGETVKAKLVLNNLNNVSKAEWTFGDDWGYKTLQLVDAKLSETFADKATVSVNGDKVTVQFKEPSGKLSDSETVEVTLKVLDDHFFTGTSINPTVNVTDANNKTIKVLNAGNYLKVNPPYSRVGGYITPKGFYIGDPGNGGYIGKKEWSKVGASIKLIDSTGKEYDATSSINEYAQYSIEKLPLTKDPYTVEMKVPGHFLTKKKVTIGFEHNGILYGKYQSIPSLDIIAGDVNQDGVIDVLDAIEIQKAWKTNNRAADINFDGIVDEQDMKFVQQNYLKQNKSVDNAPKPMTSYNGKTLETILAELGIKP